MLWRTIGRTMLAASVIAVLTLASAASADIITFTGDVDNTWATPGNWDTGAVPLEGIDTAVIPVGKTANRGGDNRTDMEIYGTVEGLTNFRGNVTVDIKPGGVLDGGGRIRDGASLLISGTWIVGSNYSDGGFRYDRSRDIHVQAGGKIQFNVTADLELEDDATEPNPFLKDHIGASAGSAHLDLYTNWGPFAGNPLQMGQDTGGTIDIVTVGGYVPEAGDSFKLFSGPYYVLVDPDPENEEPGISVDLAIGDGSNITLNGAPAVWDTTDWEQRGIVTLVPEPATLLLCGLGGFALLRRRTMK